ncbi:MAG: VVA0879 family protein [Bradyrhizobium sp.]|nr:VVA0879 family protein [Bradyrhizobium sp.]
MYDLVAAGVITEAEWVTFQEDPGYAFLRLGDERKDACWELIQRRMPAPLRETSELKGVLAMLKMTLEQAQSALKAQGVANNDMAVVCPICGTVQSMSSLVRAGAPKESVENYFGFSCEGRFSGVGPMPSSEDKSAAAETRRALRGCNWTLGGLFKLHRMEITYPDGTSAGSFEIATAEQAQALAAEITVTA